MSTPPSPMSNALLSIPIQFLSVIRVALMVVLSFSALCRTPAESNRPWKFGSVASGVTRPNRGGSKRGAGTIYPAPPNLILVSHNRAVGCRAGGSALHLGATLSEHLFDAAGFGRFHDSPRGECRIERRSHSRQNASTMPAPSRMPCRDEGSKALPGQLQICR